MKGLRRGPRVESTVRVNYSSFGICGWMLLRCISRVISVASFRSYALDEARNSELKQ